MKASKLNLARPIVLAKPGNLAHQLWQLVSDIAGMFQIMPVGQALRYTRIFVSHLPQVVRSKSLGSIDQLMGAGPFTLKNNRHAITLSGSQVLGLIREIWIRKVYLADGFLNIKSGDLVVDLGSNIGVFTTFAATYLPEGKIIAVEAQGDLTEQLKQNLARNNLAADITVLHGIIGPNSGVITTMLSNADIAPSAYYLDDVLNTSGRTMIDFLKIDIEGSEFDLFEGQSAFLNYTRQLAIEVHFDYGELKAIQNKCEQAGFECKVAKLNSPNMCLLFGRRKI